MGAVVLATAACGTTVDLADRRGTIAGLEVSRESGRDVRRELAATVVGRGWGLLELRPMRMSLEDIFLQLTTQEAGAHGETTHPDTTPMLEEVAHE